MYILCAVRPPRGNWKPADRANAEGPPQRMNVAIFRRLFHNKGIHRQRNEHRRQVMSDPFALLVDAANAKSDEEASKKVSGSPAQRAAHSLQMQQTSADSSGIKTLRSPHINITEAEYLRGALQQEALERGAVERDIMQLHAAYGGMGAPGDASGGIGRLQGMGAQEADYLHQLRLEALVQQRHQETLAQLAFAQEMDFNPQVYSLAQAEQLRQVALLRQEMIRPSTGSGSPHFGVGPQLGGLSKRPFMRERELLEERLRKERYEQQQQLASLGYGSGGNPGLIAALANKGRLEVGTPHSMAVAKQSPAATKQVQTPKTKTVVCNEDESYTIVPCPARGLPTGHTAETAYFKIPKDVKHGTPLVCSYFACRNSGAQYNYCSRCDMPVSKWNFKKLHNHRQAASLDADAILAQLVERGVGEIMVSANPSTSPNKKMTVESRKLFDSRRVQWETLLHSRPKNAGLAVEWVRQVLAVSDIDSELTIPAVAKDDSPTVRKLIKKRALPINGSKTKSSFRKSLLKKKKTEESNAVVETCDDAGRSSDRPSNIDSGDTPVTKENQTCKDDTSTEELKTAKAQNMEIMIRQSTSRGENGADNSTLQITLGSLRSIESPAHSPSKGTDTPSGKALAYDGDSGSSSASSDDSVDLRDTKRDKLSNDYSSEVEHSQKISSAARYDVREHLLDIE